MSWLKTDRIAFGLFILACVFFGILYGVAAARYRLFPFGVVSPGYEELEKSFKVQANLCPVRYEQTGVKIHDRAAMAPGVTLITSYWPYPPDDNIPAIRLIDAEGYVLHSWRTQNKAGNPTVHGSYLFDNGDVLFNREYLGLVRMDAMGKVLWTLPYRTHHSVFRGEDGNFWVCGLRWVEDDPEGRKRAADFPGLHPPFTDDRLLKVSPDGKILKDFSALEILYRSGNQHLIWKISKRYTDDVVHLNNVEVLSREMADQYPMFEAGDLVISFRDIHFVCVVDPQTLEVKWSTIGPFLEQHDPDFIGDGWIGIFDNHSDGTEDGRYLGGSRIVAIKPQTDETRILYPRPGSKSFYTKTCGKWQQLDNGNLLITESRAGRVFEVDPKGHLVWEWFHEHYDDKYVSEVMEATRYDYTPQQIGAWSTNALK